MLITPVNCISLDQQSLDLYSLTLSEGEWFSLKDFNPETYELPLILGAGFKDYYSIGDEMSLLYFGEKWTGVVKGFLEEDESIQQDLTVYDLDTMVLVPSFESLGETFDLEVQKRLYYAKNEGYLVLKDKSDYKKAKKEIQKLSDKYNLPYELLQ